MIAFGGMSESGKSSLAKGIYKKLESINVNCVRLNIAYFMELTSNALGSYVYQQLPAEKLTDQLVEQFDHYLNSHSWITMITIEILDVFAYTQIIDYERNCGYLNVKLSHDYDRNVFDIELCEATVRSSERRTEILSKYQKEVCFNVKYKVTSTIVDIKWKATYSNYRQDKQSNRFYFYTLILLISGYFLIVK
ncbi:unnamed protein product [Rotaria sp. Silwood1]|nr:unnamed protein product [Rotaria sp. Silwood1]